MTDDPTTVIHEEFENLDSAENIGMFTVKTANDTLADASLRPNPAALYKDLWYEGEVCCLFADSNLGKSIFAVQMAEEIALTQNVLLVDCELSDKQFQMRYTDDVSGNLHSFPDGLFRAEINPLTLDVIDYEEKILTHIVEVMQKFDCKVGIIDNLTYLCNNSDKGVDAGIFMMKLSSLKKQFGWSLLIIAHTPKRSLSSPITQNDLAGSKKLYNFFDCVLAIGQSARDNRLRYLKQLKVRAGEFRYDGDNVIVYEIEKTGDYTHFVFKEYSSELSHLRNPTEQDKDTQNQNVKELVDKGKSYREIARILGISKSLVGKIAGRLRTTSTSDGIEAKDKVDGVDTRAAVNDGELFE